MYGALRQNTDPSVEKSPGSPTLPPHMESSGSRGKRPRKPPPRGREPHREFLRRISTALVKTQKEIRVLKALHWPDSVGQRFLARKGLELPRVEYPPLDFDAKGRVTTGGRRL